MTALVALSDELAHEFGEQRLFELGQAAERRAIREVVVGDEVRDHALMISAARGVDGNRRHGSRPAAR